MKKFKFILKIISLLIRIRLNCFIRSLIQLTWYRIILLLWSVVIAHWYIWSAKARSRERKKEKKWSSLVYGWLTPNNRVDKERNLITHSVGSNNQFFILSLLSFTNSPKIQPPKLKHFCCQRDSHVRNTPPNFIFFYTIYLCTFSCLKSKF